MDTEGEMVARGGGAGVDFELRFTAPQRAILLERLNRFLVRVKLKGREVDSFVANPARGKKLFRPGSRVIIQEWRSPAARRKTCYDLLLVEQEGTWVLVDTRIANRVVCHCLKQRKIPELAEYDSVTREATWGSSRFDFYLSGGGKDAYLEVKSVSLAEGGVAKFPDGVTERGRRHVEELGDVARKGRRAFILFLVERDDVSLLTANFAVDPRFSASLLRGIARGVVPLSYHLVCGPDAVRLGGRVPILAEGWESSPREGCYYLLIELRNPTRLRHPRFAEKPFPAGFYVYTGSGKGNLLHRVTRHLTRKHRKRWHIDYLLESPDARILDVIVLPGREIRECLANREVGRMPGAVAVQKGFGASDCRAGGRRCPAHLYRFESLPRQFLKRMPDFSR